MADESSAVLDELQRQQRVAEARLALQKLELESATVASNIRALTPKPWWRTWNATALGALLAAVAPATAGVQGCVEKRRQYELETLRQKQEISNRYLDRLKDPDERRRTLRFLAATSSDPEFVSWAKAEQPIVTAEADRIDREAREAAGRAEAAMKAYDEALHKQDAQSVAQQPQLKENVVRTQEESKAATAKRLGAMQGQLQPDLLLSHRLRTIQSDFDTCLKAPSSNPENCIEAQQRQLVRPPTTEDLNYIVQLERSAPNDPSAANKLYDLRRQFLREP